MRGAVMTTAVLFLASAIASPALADRNKALELLSSAWQCPPETANAELSPFNWGTVADRGFEMNDDFVHLIDRKYEIVHNTEVNEITKLNLMATTAVRPSEIKAVSLEGSSLVLRCAERIDCMEIHSSASLSTDCNGYCGGQPWTSSTSVQAIRLSFCDDESAYAASEAIRRLAPKAVIETDASAPPQRTEPLLCRAADPTGTPLNIRSEPGGSPTGKTLTNGAPVEVSSFETDAKGRSWARVPRGYAYARYMICQAPEDAQ